MFAVQEAEPVRLDPQTRGEWIGTIIGEVMDWNVPDGAIKKDARTSEQSINLAAVKRAVNAWEASGLLVKVKIPHPDRSNREVAAYTVEPERIPDATT